MHVNIKDERLKDTNKGWLKFWDDMEKNVIISFKDLGGQFKPYSISLYIEKSGVWWFDLPGPLQEYDKLGITVTDELSGIIYDEVVG